MVLTTTILQSLSINNLSVQIGQSRKKEGKKQETLAKISNRQDRITVSCWSMGVQIQTYPVDFCQDPVAKHISSAVYSEATQYLHKFTILE